MALECMYNSVNVMAMPGTQAGSGPLVCTKLSAWCATDSVTDVFLRYQGNCAGETITPEG